MQSDAESEFRTVRGYQQILQRNGGLTSAMEDYLEMVYRLCGRDGYTRVGKISELLNVKPSSASKMIFKLAQLGYIKYNRYEIILLTGKGETTGSFLLNRHNTVERFLKLIGVSDSLVETELVEHSFGKATVAHLIVLLEFFNKNPDALAAFRGFQRSSGG